MASISLNACSAIFWASSFFLAWPLAVRRSQRSSNQGM